MRTLIIFLLLTVWQWVGLGALAALAGALWLWNVSVALWAGPPRSSASGPTASEPDPERTERSAATEENRRAPEPWEIYCEAFYSDGWAAPTDPIPSVRGPGTARKAHEAYGVAREALIDHLSSASRLTRPMRDEVDHRFFKASIRWLEEMKLNPGRGEEHLREILRNEYTEWRLSRG